MYLGTNIYACPSLFLSLSLSLPLSLSHSLSLSFFLARSLALSLSLSIYISTYIQISFSEININDPKCECVTYIHRSYLFLLQQYFIYLSTLTIEANNALITYVLYNSYLPAYMSRPQKCINK